MVMSRLKLLLELLKTESLPASRLRSAAKDLTTPFAAGLLVRRTKGAGEVVEVAKPEAFRKWISHTHPGAFGGMVAENNRAMNLAMNRDTKVGRRGLGHYVVLARAYRVRQDLPDEAKTALQGVVDATLAWGGVALLLDGLGQDEHAAPPSLRLPEGLRVMTIEGPQNFKNSGRVQEEADIFLLCGTGGRLRGEFIEWLAGQETLQVIHSGDYDPVGLQEFMTMAARMPGRVELYCPDDLANRFRSFSNRTLMDKGNNRAVLGSLRRGVSREMDLVLRLMAEFGPLEQEALLIDTITEFAQI